MQPVNVTVLMKWASSCKLSELELTQIVLHVLQKLELYLNKPSHKEEHLGGSVS